MRWITAILAGVLLAVTASCDRPRPQEDQLGGTQTGGAAASPRIVALSPAVAIMLRDIGAERMIVGRHGYDLVLDPAIPTCGDQAGIDFEMLLRVKPTHVVSQWGARALPERLTEIAAGNGWHVRDVAMLTLGEIREQTLSTAAFIGDPSLQQGATRVVAEFDAALASKPGQHAAAGRVLLLASIEPPSALGPGSCHHEVLERIGATPALTDGSPYQTLDAERLLTLNPETIVLVLPRAARAPDDPSARTPEAALRQAGPVGRLSLAAVRSGRIVLIDDPTALIPSTSITEFARQLDRLLTELGPVAR